LSYLYPKVSVFANNPSPLKQVLIIFFALVSLNASSQYNWTAQTSGTNQNLYSVFFTTNSFNLALNGFTVGGGGTIRTTANMGVNWTGQTSGTGVTLYEVYFPTQTDGWIVGANGTILHTANTGNNWTPQTSGTTQTLWCVYFSSILRGWAVGANGTILYTNDGGLTWSPQTSGTAVNLWCVKFADDTLGWITGDNGIILKTINGGTTWTAQNSNVMNVLWSISLEPCNPNEAFVSGNGGLILKTTNGGVTWTPLISGTGNFLHWIDFNNTICAGFTVGGNGEIRSSMDYGNSWTQNTSNTTQNLRSVFMTVPLDMFGWAVGDGGTIRMLTQPLSVSENESSGINIYPNPSNGIVNCQLSAVNGTPAIIGVYNAIGEMVYMENLKPQTSNFKLNLSNHPKGIYFIKITDGSNQVIRKIILN
jgi:photosystem II stability/assembly factor-like uncharacterized protein